MPLPTPHKYQSQIISSLKRFNVLICHRRFGKTVLAITLLIIEAARGDNEWRGAYIAPTYRQAKGVSWDYLKRFLGDVTGTKFNESDLTAVLPNGAKISLYGAESYDALRGLYFNGVVLDEVAQMPAPAWTQIIRPALSDKKGWAIFIGTPNGKNLLQAIWEDAKREPAWYAAMFRASETDIIDAEELESAKRSMSPDDYAQEFECSFSVGAKGAYYSGLLEEAEKAGRICSVPYEPLLPVVTAWDLGVSDSTAIWFAQQHAGGKIAVIDYYEAQGEGLPHYAEVLKRKPYHYGQHIAPHDISVRELGSGRSRIEIAQSLGIRFNIAANIPVQDGINAVRVLLPRCWFDADKCRVGLDALKDYRREFNTRLDEFKDKPLHNWTSHASDAFRYFAVGHRPERSGNRPTRTINDYNPFQRRSRKAWAVL